MRSEIFAFPYSVYLRIVCEWAIAYFFAPGGKAVNSYNSDFAMGGGMVVGAQMFDGQAPLRLSARSGVQS